MTLRRTPAALSIAAFSTLLLIALLMGANHVAARIAFDHGVDVTTAVAVRSIVTALVVGALIVVQRVPVVPTRRHVTPSIAAPSKPSKISAGQAPPSSSAATSRPPARRAPRRTAISPP